MATSTPRARIGRSNRLVIYLAVGLGLIGAVLVFVAVRQAGSDDTEVSGITVPVVVAAQDIAARQPVSLEMLAVEEVPIERRHALAFEEIAQVEGKVTRFPIYAGEQVLGSRLATRTALSEQGQQAGLAFVVPPGMRSMSITVNEVIGSGGLIVPGDFVDVMMLYDVQVPRASVGKLSVFQPPLFSGTLGLAAEAGSEETVPVRVSQTILQNMEVLAVAQTLQEILPSDSSQETGALASSEEGAPGAPPVGRSEGIAVRRNADPNPSAATFTLAMTPEQAELLFAAEQSGTLRLALRPFGEPDEAPPAPVILIGLR